MSEAAPEPKPETDETLQRAQDAYDRGDFGTARRLLAGLAKDHEGARTLRRRLAPDPLAIVVAVVCAVAFVVIFLAYAGH